MSIKGLDEVLKNLNSKISNIKGFSKEAMQDNILDLQGESQRRAPVDEGDLRGSASNKISVNGSKITGTVGFNEPYALRQHEGLQFHHPKGGGAKYLENPLSENTGKYVDHLANSVKKAIK